MKQSIIHAAVFFILLPSTAPSLAGEWYYPEKSWDRVAAPEKLGWSREKLKAARDYSATIQTAAAMVVVNGQVLDEWGETAARTEVHSVRKSLLSALYGIHVAAGRIDLSATLAALGIDDNRPSLTPREKTATVRDLLKFRSGIYHPVSNDNPNRRPPPRGSQAPGTLWHYNNWDANALGTIFELRTNNRIFEEFKAKIAEPIGMEDFRLSDGSYETGPDSIHPWYIFRMSARDMARFGLLFLRDGAWRGRQLIPKDWVRESTATSYSNTGRYGGYGYMWWVSRGGAFLPSVRLPEGSFSAWGSGGHYILVIPPLDLVIVHRASRVEHSQFGELVRLILEAGNAATPRSN